MRIFSYIKPSFRGEYLEQLIKLSNYVIPINYIFSNLQNMSIMFYTTNEIANKLCYHLNDFDDDEVNFLMIDKKNRSMRCKISNDKLNSKLGENHVNVCYIADPTTLKFNVPIEKYVYNNYKKGDRSIRRPYQEYDKNNKKNCHKLFAENELVVMTIIDLVTSRRTLYKMLLKELKKSPL